MASSPLMAVDASRNFSTQSLLSLSYGLSPAMSSAEAAERYKRMFESQIAELRYCIRALQDMPGRKILFFMSASIDYQAMDPWFAHIDEVFNSVADEALRAGVTIMTMDMNGLSVSGQNLAAKYLPLSKKTGGVIVTDSNYFLNGIGPAEEELKGYYLLSYSPPAKTFDDNHRNVYHHIRVKVKRPGIQVHSRDGFFGLAGRSNLVSNAQTHTLQEAIFSPFRYNDLGVSLASGYAHASKPGYFLRSWLHLEGKDLTFVDEPEGGHSLSIELVTLTADSDGAIQDSKGLQYGFRVNDEELFRIRREGADFDIYLPVKKPGDYYVRAAIRDRASGRIGSAYQFLSIPDLKKRRLSLSSIFMLNQDEKTSVIKSGEMDVNSSPLDFDRKWQRGSKSPAVRSYLPGESFDYVAYIYNAKTGEGMEPGLESQFTIFKDGKEYYKGNSEPVDIIGKDPLKGIPVVKGIVFDTIEEGEYLLELTVMDKQAKQKFSTVVQSIDFEIQKGSSAR